MRLIFDPWATAERDLLEDRRRNPNFADIRNLCGLLFLERGEWSEAWTEFEAAVEINPRYAAARFNRLVARRLRDGSLPADVWRTEAAEFRVEEPLRSLWSAWYFAQAGQFSEVFRGLEALTTDSRWNGLAAFTAAIYAHCSGDHRRAAGYLCGAAKGHPFYEEILMRRGVLERRDDARPEKLQLSLAPEPSAAVRAMDAASWNPLTAALYEHLALICATQGAGDDAAALYEEAFLRQGDEARHLLRMSRLSLAHGNEEGAMRSLLRAIECDATSVEARVALGSEYQSQGFPDEAVVQFEVAARLRPKFPDVQYNLGLLYEAVGRAADGVRCYRAALAINPNYFQARMSLAQALLESSAHAEAIVELDRLLLGGAPSADLLVQKAEAHLAIGENNAAVELLERAAALNPSFPRTYYVMGQAYRVCGLKRKAQEAWRQYLERTQKWQEGQPLRQPEVKSA